MSALQFLNKKSWHTSTIKNNEKVWLKEQAAEKEKKRIEELRKQLDEERKLQQIHRLEEESGRLDPAELLKRRRLNWMYEHGPAPDDKQQDKDREDMLLGKKQVDLEKLQEARPARSTLLVDAEAKMREDPLVEIQMRRATALRRAGRDPSTRNDAHADAKRRRKEERARIREERRLRREKRARSADDASRRGDLADGNSEPPGSDHRSSRDETRGEQKDHGDGTYGLSFPAGESGVAVTREFTRRNRKRERGRPSVRRDASPDFREARRDDSRRDPVEREKRLEEMRRDADRIEAERRDRLTRHARNERDEERRPRADGVPGRAFARDAIAAGVSAASAADRIRQRRAWAARDSNASY